MDRDDKAPLTTQQRRRWTVLAVLALAATTVAVTTGWLQVPIFVVTFVSIVVGLGFIHEQPWAIRFGAWATERDERARANPRPVWQRLLLVTAAVAVAALLISVTGA